jgi:hypothetical protein
MYDKKYKLNDVFHFQLVRMTDPLHLLSYCPLSHNKSEKCITSRRSDDEMFEIEDARKKLKIGHLRFSRQKSNMNDIFSPRRSL